MRLHWVLDMTFGEDRSRSRKDCSPENLALLRKLAMNTARLKPSRQAMRGKLKIAGWNNEFLRKLLVQFI